MQVAATQREPETRRRDPDGWPLPDVDAGARYALNIEQGARGELVTSRSPLPAAASAGRPVFADRCDDTTYIYTVDSSNHLKRFELPAEGADGFAAPELTTICTLPQPLREMVRCGDFLVARLLDGTLFYLSVSSESHAVAPLGSVPEAPKVRVREVGKRTFSTTTAPFTFSTAVEDLRPGVPADVAAKFRAAAQSAADDLASMAMSNGLWTAPVCVRVAVRLRDGSLLSVSEPLPVGVGFSQASQMPVFPLKYGAKGYTGAGSADLSAQAFGIEVEVSGMPSENWNGIIRSLEIWVSPQDPTPPSFANSKVSYNYVSDNVRVGYPTSPLTNLERLSLGPQLLLATLPAGDCVLTLTRDETAAGGNPRLETVARRNVQAGVMTAHDTFLHLGDVRRPLPEPPMPVEVFGDGDEPENVICVVTVDMRVSTGAAGGGYLSARSAGTLRTAKLAPLLWYPSSRAETIRIGLRRADGSCLEKTFPLTPATDGSDAAYYIGSGRELAGLEAVDSLDYSTSGEAFERDAGAVMSMARGNPMVSNELTRCADDTVQALQAQVTGGGAYTRQYLYAFSNSGVTALMHDAAGRHVNARKVSMAVGVKPEGICATPEGVFALSSSGELLRLRDARAETIIRGLTEYSRLAWHRATNRLWLMPAAKPDGSISGALGKSLALELTPGIAQRFASLQSVVPGQPISADGSFLTAAWFGTVWRLYRFADGHTPGASQLPARWVSEDFDAGFDGPALLTVNLSTEVGNPVEVTVAGLDDWLSDASLTYTAPLAEARSDPQTHVAHALEIPLLLPSKVAGFAPEKCSLSVAGRWSRLANWSLSRLNFGF